MAQVHPIDSAHEAEELAAHLCSEERRRPAVVVTTSGRDAPHVDVRQVADEVGDLAEVYLVSRATYARVLTDLMPAGAGLVARAGRAYPAGTSWLDHPSIHPVRRAYEAGEGARSTRLLVSDALALAADAEDAEDQEPDRTTRVWATARVVRVPMPERAWLLVGRTWAHVAQELTVPGVDLDRVLAPDMDVSGWLDPGTGRLDVRPSFADAASTLARYRPGDVVLARVRGVRPEQADVLLHPDVCVTVHRDDVTGNDRDDLRGLMTSGEVLAARVVRRGPRWALSLLDVDDTEQTVPAPSLLPGGPPWLVPEPDPEPAPETTPEPVPPPPTPGPVPADPPPGTGVVAAPARTRPSPAMLDRRRRPGPTAAAPAPAAPAPRPTPAPPPGHRPRPGPPRPAGPAAPAAGSPAAAAPAAGATQAPAPGSATASMARTIDGLRADLLGARAALAESEEQVRSALAEIEDLVEDRRVAQVDLHRLRQEVRALRASARRARQQRATAAPPSPARPEFADAEAGFRHAVLTDWATRIPVGEQPDCPLVDYDLGPRFLDSLAALDGVSTQKVAAVVVDVLTGRAAALAGRALHQLRTSDSGGSAAVRRDEDGALCWRAALQNGTAQARRLHYWVLPGGRVELSRVVLHDDTDP